MVKLSQILLHGTNKRKEARMQKSGQVFTFLVHKTQLPFFFLRAKYGLKQIQLVENMIKKVQMVIPFSDIRSVSSTED